MKKNKEQDLTPKTLYGLSQSVNHKGVLKMIAEHPNSNELTRRICLMKIRND
jgi:hypothetical protein